jgi:hypothetical protein
LIDPGWAFTFLALVYVLLIGVVLLVMRDGMKWRLASEEKKRLKAEKEKERSHQLELSS